MSGGEKNFTNVPFLRSIYDQINNLVSRHEQRPEQLAKIFHDLQNMSGPDMILDQGAMSASFAAASAQSSSATGARNQARANSGTAARYPRREAAQQQQDQGANMQDAILATRYANILA